MSQDETVFFQNEELCYEKYKYYMMNKAAGTVTAKKDNLFPTVMDGFLPTDGKDLSPVGRLDKDTEGLLLITNDGELAHRLLSPKYHVDKTYYARLRDPIEASAVEVFASGMDIGEDKLCKPATLTILTPNEVHVTISEGKYHQVKRMFHGIGNEVLYLKRLRMGSLELDETLEKGTFRSLTEAEKKGLEKAWQRKNITQ